MSQSVKAAAAGAVASGAHFAVHWFGARRFQYQQDLEDAELAIRSSSPKMGKLVHDLSQENFKISNSRPGKAAPPVPPDAGLEKPAALPGSFLVERARAALEGTHRYMLDAETTGPCAEELVTQHRPTYIALQLLVTSGLYILFRILSGEVVAGLESVIPGQTLLVLHRDCHDHRAEVWRWLTYQFTHASFLHLAVNMLLVLVAGVPLEGFHGPWRMAASFNLGVLGGAGLHMVFLPHTVGLAGMSAGCYALIGMHWGDLLMNWHQSKFRRAKFVLLVLLVAVEGLFMQAIPQGQHVSHPCHLGGFVTGFLVCLTFGRNLRWTFGSRVVQGVALCVGLTLAAFCMGWMGEHWPPRGPFDEEPWCWARQANSFAIFGDHLWHCVRCQDEACIQQWSSQGTVADVNHVLCNDHGFWE